MRLLLRRLDHSEQRTIGELYVDEIFECFTLEDPVRDGPKIPGKTAIPAGTYAIAMTYSPRFKMVLPLLVDVPGFDGVRIHAGNTAEDTEGCILVGRTREPNAVGNSRVALGVLLEKLRLPCTITIEDAWRGGVA